MLSDKNYIIGNIPYFINELLTSANNVAMNSNYENNADVIIIPPRNIELDVTKFDFKYYDLCLAAKNIVSYQETPEFRPINKFTGEAEGIENILFPEKLNRPYLSDCPLTIEYHQGVEDLEAEISNPNMHVVFGDGVKEVGVINGGHVTLGKETTGIHGLKKAEVRIDFRSVTPPSIGVVSPGALGYAELHVPTGTREAYASHPQWGKANKIVEEEMRGPSLMERLQPAIDEYKANLPGTLREIQEDIAKENKVKTLNKLAHVTYGKEKLAKWDVEIQEWDKNLDVKVWFHYIGLTFSVSLDKPIDIWDDIVKLLERADEYLAK